MSDRNKKALILIGAVAFIVVLYLQSTQIVSKKEDTVIDSGDFFTRILSQVKASLKREELEPVAKLENALEKANKESNQARAGLLDSLAHVWQRLQVPALSAHYLDEKAKLMSTESNELDAGAGYFEAFSIAEDTALKSWLVQGAIRNYEKVISLNPANLEAKSNLAMCYAEGTTNPMQGIMMLREIVTKDPKNENAQYDLGLLSIRSGQLDKAIERFGNVLEINPSRYDVYFLRGTTYIKLSKNENALKDFEKVKNESGNAAMISEADNYINKLLKNN